MQHYGERMPQYLLNPVAEDVQQIAAAKQTANQTYDEPKIVVHDNKTTPQKTRSSANSSTTSSSSSFHKSHNNSNSIAKNWFALEATAEDHMSMHILRTEIKALFWD